MSECDAGNLGHSVQCAGGTFISLASIYYTVICFYFVLYLISYAAVRTKIKRTNIIQQCNFHTCFIYDMGSVRN